MSNDQSEFGDSRTIPKRKIRHLETLSIHNLTSTPHRDELLSLPLVKPTDSLTTGYNTPQREGEGEENGEEEDDVSKQVGRSNGVSSGGVTSTAGGNIARKARRRMTLDDLELLNLPGKRGRRISIGSAKSPREPSISTTPSFSAQLSSSPLAMLHLPSTTSHQPRRPSLSRARTSSRLSVPSNSAPYLPTSSHPSPTMDPPSSPFLSSSLNTTSGGRPRSSSRVSVGSSCSDRTIRSVGPGYNLSDHSRIDESKEEIEPDSLLADESVRMKSLGLNVESEENDPLMLASSRLLESFVVLSLAEETIKNWAPPSGGSTKGKERASPMMISTSTSVDSAFPRQAQRASSYAASHQKPVPPVLSTAMARTGSADVVPTSYSSIQDPVPFFISRIQQASTHPLYGEFDPEHDFSDEMGSFVGRLTVFKVEVFVRRRRRKGADEEGWRILKSWKVHLERLKRWNGKSFLPPNTLIITLSSHPNTLYYLPPPPDPASEIPVLTRNVSDGELNLLPSGEAQKKRGKVLGRAGWDGGAEKSVLEKSLRETKMKRGIGIGELLKLVNLQSVLEDTRQSTRAIEAGLNNLIEKDNEVAGMIRDLSERKDRMKRLREHLKLKQQSRHELQRCIDDYRHNIQRREELLQAGEACLVEERAHIAEINSFSHTLTANRHALRPYFQYHRSRLTSTLEGIFPIGPKVHNRALVFTILDVALPTPIDKEPAPPLHLAVEDLPAGIQVDEQSIAAALGYVTMLVHLLAKYLRKGLVYPLTPAQSRSLVKDPVSDMQGPTRMFPLYSKGVAKYRFEYAVHLLNKDIELLMTDRNLKTVDLRHTLANLMNLLMAISSSHVDPPGSIASLPPLSTLSSLKTESHSLGLGSSLTCHGHNNSHASNGSVDGELTMTTSVGGSTNGDNSVVSEEEEKEEDGASGLGGGRREKQEEKGERVESEQGGRDRFGGETEADKSGSQTPGGANGNGPVASARPVKTMNGTPSRVAIDGLPGLS
ncbi:UV radiation resistance associated protein [Phaffia rhodozyma]|uniref:Autophagy-related protein 14 n=1 Tax=Phaffia rhodozyma TaxID=264483 RepID=A0A0F7SGP3_PHARH|nr:UV radiation resistance associated protein [Phaffia rhodozyma]